MARWRGALGWFAATAVFVGVVVLTVLRDRNRGDEVTPGTVTGAVLFGLAVGLVVRFVYFKYLDRADRRLRSPWILVIGAAVLYISLVGQQNRGRAAECGNEPPGALLRPLPDGLEYGDVSPSKQREAARAIRIPGGDPAVKVIRRGGRRVGAVIVYPPVDRRPDLQELRAGLENNNVALHGTAAVPLAGTTWIEADLDVGYAYAGSIRCHLMMVAAREDDTAQAIVRVLAKAD
jgi:hypothetical protein